MGCGSEGQSSRASTRRGKRRKFTKGQQYIGRVCRVLGGAGAHRIRARRQPWGTVPGSLSPHVQQQGCTAIPAVHALLHVMLHTVLRNHSASQHAAQHSSWASCASCRAARHAAQCCTALWVGKRLYSAAALAPPPILDSLCARLAARARLPPRLLARMLPPIMELLRVTWCLTRRA